MCQLAVRIQRDGISLDIVDLRTLVPVDRAAIAASLQRTGKMLILHRANRTRGTGAEPAAFVAEEHWGDLDTPLRRIGAADCHLHNGAEEGAVLPSLEQVVSAITRLAHY